MVHSKRGFGCHKKSHDQTTFRLCFLGRRLEISGSRLPEIVTTPIKNAKNTPLLRDFRINCNNYQKITNEITFFQFDR